jgi:hypothetical protein
LSGWHAVIGLSALFLAVPIIAGFGELKARE